jgi:hypothetical protein
VWDVEEEEGVSGEVLEGANFQVDFDLTKRNMAHHHVLTNTTANGRLGQENPFTLMHS